MIVRFTLAFTMTLLLFPLNKGNAAITTQTGRVIIQKAEAPRWRYTYNKETLSLQIVVTTHGLRINEALTQGKCKMFYFRIGKTEPDQEILTLKTPIQANKSDTQVFALGSDIERVKGISLDWEVSVKGSKPTKNGQERAIQRTGSSPPSE